MIMKKFINDPFEVTNELVEGFVMTNKPLFRKLDGMNVVVKTDMPKKGKIGVLIGGGSGHEPLFLEFIGKGMGDCAVHGNIFASPSSDMIYEGIKSVDSGSGVIMVYGNYQGDIINFDMAQDMARMIDNIKIETVRVWDDIASAPPTRKDERRGISGDLFVVKTAGAASEAGYDLENVVRVTEKARDNCRSIGIALSSCTLPAVGKPIFEIEDDSMMVGMGVHGEQGIEKRKLMTADNAAKLMLDYLLADDLKLTKDDEIALIVNSYGSTTRMETLIIARCLYKLLESIGIGIYGTDYGDLCTSQEMSGVSVTIMKLDSELKKLYDMDAISPGWTHIKY